jgi:hypothetical protein
MDRLVGGYHVIEGNHRHPSLAVCPAFKLSVNRGKVFGRLAGGKLTQLKTNESAFIETDSYSF